MNEPYDNISKMGRMLFIILEKKYPEKAAIVRSLLNYYNLNELHDEYEFFGIGEPKES